MGRGPSGRWEEGVKQKLLFSPEPERREGKKSTVKVRTVLSTEEYVGERQSRKQTSPDATEDLGDPNEFLILENFVDVIL
jgi:hypothetical protein